MYNSKLKQVQRDRAMMDIARWLVIWSTVEYSYYPYSFCSRMIKMVSAKKNKTRFFSKNTHTHAQTKQLQQQQENCLKQIQAYMLM